MFCGILCMLLSVGFAQTVQDSTKVEKLDEVYLTDSRFALKRENSGKVITKITSEDLEKLQGQSIAEIIGRTVGVEINGVRSNAGQNLSYFIRGGRNRQVLIMIDGVQVTDPSQIANDYDLRLLNTDQVESIEILKGASSTLYGTGAAAAVINIKLKEASKKKFNVSLRSTAATNRSSEDGSYAIEDFRNSVSVNGTIGQFSYLASFGLQSTDGLSAIENTSESDKFKSTNANIKLGYKFNDAFKLNAYAGFDNFDANFDDSFGFVDADNVSKSNQYRIGISPQYKYSNGSVVLNAAYNDVEREIASDFPSMFNAQSLVLDAYNRYNFNDKVYTVLGINFQNNTMESFSIPFGETDFSQAINPNNATFNSFDTYVNAVYVSDFGLNINAGLRLNNHSEYGSYLVYSINPSFKETLEFGYLKGMVSYSTAFITPSLFQLFEPSFGNPNLEPEENDTFEIGAELYLNNKATLSLVYFNRNEDNFIDFVDTGGFVFQYRNIGESFKANGLEFVANVSTIKNISFNTNVTYTKVREDIGIRIPKLKINARLDYQLSDKTTLGVSYQFNDDRNDVFFDNTTFQSISVNLEPYILTDFYISHKILNNRMTLFANITNIFNEEYQELFGFETRGRGVNLGFNLSL